MLILECSNASPKSSLVLHCLLLQIHLCWVQRLNLKSKQRRRPVDRRQFVDFDTNHPAVEQRGCFFLARLWFMKKSSFGVSVDLQTMWAALAAVARACHWTESMAWEVHARIAAIIWERGLVFHIIAWLLESTIVVGWSLVFENIDVHHRLREEGSGCCHHVTIRCFWAVYNRPSCSDCFYGADNSEFKDSKAREQRNKLKWRDLQGSRRRGSYVSVMPSDLTALVLPDLPLSSREIISKTTNCVQVCWVLKCLLMLPSTKRFSGEMLIFAAVIHFYFGSVQFSVKRKFAVSVRKKFRYRERDPDNFEQAVSSVNPELKFR